MRMAARQDKIMEQDGDSEEKSSCSTWKNGTGIRRFVPSRIGWRRLRCSEDAAAGQIGEPARAARSDILSCKKFLHCLFRNVSDLFKILSGPAPNHYLRCRSHIQSGQGLLSGEDLDNVTRNSSRYCDP